MTTARRILRPSTLVATSILLPFAVCIFVLTATLAAQTAAAPPAAVPATGQAPMPHVQFNVASIPQPKAGRAYAYNLCTGQVIPDAAIWGRPGLHAYVRPAKGLKYDTAHPCPSTNSLNSMVSGGIGGPYHFQLEPGGFPPLGMHLGLNGTLYGKPLGNPPLGGYQPFSVCAVDLGGNQNCQKMNFSAPSTQAKAKGEHHGPPPLALVGVGLGLAAIGVGVGAASSSSGGTLHGHCAPNIYGQGVNACGPCTCTANACNPSSQCGGGDCWTSSAVPPFCP